MYLRPRIIPCLLLKGKGLVKTIKFSSPNYLGDPINIVRLFNDKEVDEIIVLDIEATKTGLGPRYQYLRQIVSECFMPVCYGGGVQTTEEMRKLFYIGVEKISINTHAYNKPELIKTAADEFGSQSIIVSVDVKRNLFSKYEVTINNGTKNTRVPVIDFVKKMEDHGAGEILINSIDRDGTMQGYDINLIRQVSGAVSIPVIACGGAGKVQDLADAIISGGASAAAAGSLFVYQGKHRAVLVSYPKPLEIDNLLKLGYEDE
jgi:imidazole glycerol-phosphate synthase subunit HisF